MPQEIRGVLTALTTPFDADENIDVPALRRVVDRSVEAGVNGVVAGGSTGEFASLTPDERRRLVDAVTEHVGGRVPVIAQTGATTTQEALRHSEAARAAGADVLMLVTPYYEPLSLEETVAYIEEVSSSVELPVMLYNIPGATGVNLDPDTVGRLARKHENIRYIKDSSVDWEQALRLIHHHGDVIDTFIGWDTFIYSALLEGAAGVMAGAANVVPGEIVSVYRAVTEGRLDEARAEWARLYPVIDAMISEPFIAAVKAGLRIQGEPVGAPRSPMGEISPAANARIEEALASLEKVSK
ncbi:4-hydroxy-tetrahydrodipicolinate synthase [Rothia sp. AR01]|uniref:4-hydroxy-tetrahydrodipicolinate synthase n=1 Tax=Rothia santali TaxID=2949643 RepID=A0A9X2KLV1_9MICC|nr:4-hydroxy-tetrahydrodipicolinate synthase [Rothia santali]MCP3426551.1 4-hydroxy-tetrahydrodipicolinate synthase [Rothia santali]